MERDVWECCFIFVFGLFSPKVSLWKAPWPWDAVRSRMLVSHLNTEYWLIYALLRSGCNMNKCVCFLLIADFDLTFKYFQTVYSVLEGHYLSIWYAILSLFCKCSLKLRLRLYTPVHLQMWLIICCVCKVTLHLWAWHIPKEYPFTETPSKVFDVTLYNYGIKFQMRSNIKIYWIWEKAK